MSVAIGDIYGNYRLEQELGSGGMGRVFLGRHQHLGWLAAVKVMHPHLAIDPSFRARFLREAVTIARLDHPNIIKLYDFGEQGDALYLVMELVTDGSLRALLRRRGEPDSGWSPDLAVDIARQTADGLSYAHTRGAVHRDIKPDNLMLQRATDPGAARPYAVKITDFGLAQIAEGSVLTASGAMVGTPAYMSPEQCQGLDLDARSDIYSLGVILYEAVTGRLPFASRTISDAVYNHVYVEPPPPGQVLEGIPPALEQIIMRCLAKRPADRFASASELAQALGRVARGERGLDIPAAPIPQPVSAPEAAISTPARPTISDAPEAAISTPTQPAISDAAGPAALASSSPDVASQPASSQPEEPTAARRPSRAKAAIAVAAGALVVLLLAAGALAFLRDDEDGDGGSEDAGAVAESTESAEPTEPVALGDAANVVQIAQVPTLAHLIGEPLSEPQRTNMLYQMFDGALLLEVPDAGSGGSGVIVASFADETHGEYVYFTPDDIAALPEVASDDSDLDPPFDRLLLGNPEVAERVGAPVDSSDGRAARAMYERAVIVWLSETSRAWVFYTEDVYTTEGEWEAFWVPYEPQTASLEDGARQIELVSQLETERADLGSPVSEPRMVAFRAQQFERGFMVDASFLSDELSELDGVLLALTQTGDQENGRPQHFRLDEQTWAPPPDQAPPDDRHAASYPFSLVWNTDSDLRARLGWAWNRDTDTAGVYQLFEGGMVIWTPESGRVWVVIGDPLSDEGAHWTSYYEQ